MGRREYTFGNGCTISHVSTGPQPEQIQSSRADAGGVQGGSFLRKEPLGNANSPESNSEFAIIRPAQPAERNWLAIGVAAAVVLAVLAGLILILGHGKTGVTVTPLNAASDPYAANLVISHLEMSQSSNLAGGQVTYVDGQIVNQGSRTVTGITVQVLFRDSAEEVAQNETQPLKLIRTRDPYIDVEPVSAAPLKPGDERDFRLIFDTLTQDWDGAYPEIRIIHVDTK